MIENFYPVFAYLLGSTPFGLVLSNLFGDKKLRQSGSKNIGSTNVFRTQGKVLGILTFLLDFLKGFVIWFWIRTDNEIINLLVMAAPVIGHIFPVWLKFKGGKGIATYFGVLCALSPIVFFSIVIIWGTMFFITKISAVAGLISVATSIIIFNYTGTALCWNFINQLYVLIALVVLIIVRHRENIKQLMQRS
ncbi:MAG: glycerol-3-phosphate 1-O-acyltransferase PlsY [Holosporaceae bacterium]|jgi:glycerol-3-phosphate acyltransferase PlsY|nr:glycerol-3-phosphate 1-O-acyltransferase PlsY [Holosporaceae bacterium]